MAKLEGVAELTRKLNAMGAATAGKELRGTARQSMKVLQNAAIAAAPVGTVPHTTYKGRRVFGGFTKRTMRLAAWVNKRTGVVEAVVGPSGEAFYATSFVERGTSKMGARPWLRPAFAAVKDQVLESIGTQLRKRLERIARRRR
jgi:HK97 gp10 family phage protein